MARYRAKLTKILDDGTEIDLVDIEDYPWFVRPVLKDAVAKYLKDTAPPTHFEGQMELRVAP